MDLSLQEILAALAHLGAIGSSSPVFSHLPPSPSTCQCSEMRNARATQPPGQAGAHVHAQGQPLLSWALSGLILGG